LCLLILEQNQRNAYHEVLIAGDLTEEDVNRANTLRSSWLPYGMSDTTEFVYGNDTVYFAQPSPS